MCETRISSLIGKITVLVMLGLCVNTALALDGSGTEQDPWRIKSLDDFNDFAADANYWDGYTRLETDVNLTGQTYTTSVIAPDVNNVDSGFQGTPFYGVFDGNDHKVINLTIDDGGAGNAWLGLFGCINYGEVRNLGLEGGSVKGARSHVGGLCGYNREYSSILNCHSTGDVSGLNTVGGLVGFNTGSISNCYSTGDVNCVEDVGGLVGRNYGSISDCYSTGSVTGTGDDFVGGLVGYNWLGNISNCYSTGNVNGVGRVGGLVGRNDRGSFSNCYSTSDVNGVDDVGGLVGSNQYWSASVSNCYSTGDINGINDVGGLVGYIYDGSVSQCYSTGSVTGNDFVGGLVGWNDDASISNCFWDNETQTHGVTKSIGENEGTVTNVAGLPTAEMQMMSTFTDAGWDFVGETVNGIEDLWFIPQQDYPHLWWEGMQVPMKLTPRKLNCRSNGNWVKAHITLPQGFTVEDVNSNRPAILHSFGFQSLPLYVFVNDNELVEIEAAFERKTVCSLTGNWPQALIVTGFLADGNIFLGTSKVRIIHPGMKVIEDLAGYWLNADCLQPDFCDGIDMNGDSSVNLLDYALLMNTKVEFVTDE